MKQEHLETLESIIDSEGLAPTLSALSEICQGKAEHLRMNWQDSASGHIWEISGRRIKRTAEKLDL